MQFQKIFHLRKWKIWGKFFTIIFANWGKKFFFWQNIHLWLQLTNHRLRKSQFDQTQPAAEAKVWPAAKWQLGGVNVTSSCWNSWSTYRVSSSSRSWNWIGFETRTTFMYLVWNHRWIFCQIKVGWGGRERIWVGETFYPKSANFDTSYPIFFNFYP